MYDAKDSDDEMKEQDMVIKHKYLLQKKSFLEKILKFFAI